MGSTRVDSVKMRKECLTCGEKNNDVCNKGLSMLCRRQSKGVCKGYKKTQNNIQTMLQKIKEYDEEQMSAFLLKIQKDNSYISNEVCAECKKTRQCGSETEDITDCPYSTPEAFIRAFLEIEDK